VSIPDFPLVGVGAIIIEDGRVLLVKRDIRHWLENGPFQAVYLKWAKPCAKRQSAKPGRDLPQG